MYHLTARPSSLGRRIVTIALMLCAAVWMPGTARATSSVATSVDADQVKAGFVFNFARFVQWPSPVSGPLVIGVVADDAFATALERVVQGRTVEGRALVVRRLRDGTDPSGCHLLFISASWRGRTADILQNARGPILTVGESVQFLREGGAVRLYHEDNRIRFQISRENGEAVGLKFSSQLLSLASR